VSIYSQVVEWFGDPAHWSGPDGVPTRVLEHIAISMTAVAIALLISLPIGMYIGHSRRFEFLVVSIANLGRAIPSFAILSIAFQVVLRIEPKIAFGFVPTVIALILLGIPPIITNTYVGIQSVEPDTVEAARGMGLRGRQLLARLEVPLAMPLIVAGVRTAAVQIVATATLAALIAGGGLGRYIIDGFATFDEGQIVAGAILVAALAILTEVVFALAERLVTPRTRSGAGGRRRGRPGVDRMPLIEPGAA
jgi:osmoprotectant transport system permease protein